MASRMERASRGNRGSNRQRQKIRDDVRKTLNRTPLANLDLIMITFPSSTIKPEEKVHYLNFFVEEYCKGDLSSTLYQYLPQSLQQFFSKLRPLLFHEHVQLRSAALRASRHLISDTTSANLLSAMGLPIFVSMSLEAHVHRQFETERSQAMGVARQLIRMQADGLKGIVSSLVQIGSDYTDPFHLLATEVLCEVAVYNPKLLAYANGFQVLTATALDCQHASHSIRNMAIVQALLYVANTPQGRSFLRTEATLCSLLAPLLDPDFVHASVLTPHKDGSLVHNSTPQQTRAARTNASRLAAVYMMRSWAGIFTLTSSPTGLPALIQLLLEPATDSAATTALIAMVFQLLLLPLPAWTDDFAEAIAGRAPAFYSPSGLQRREPRPDLLDMYRAAVVMAVAQAGLVDALIHLITSTDSDVYLRTRCTVLLSDVSELVANLLPHHHGNRIQTMPLLTTLASSASAAPTQRILAHEACSNLSLARRVRRRTYHRPPVPVDVGEKLRHLEAEDDTFFLRPTTYQSDVPAEVQAARFSNSLRSSHVLDRNTAWNWQFLPEVVSSPLLYRANPSPSTSKSAHVTEALLHGKVVDRFLSYLGHVDYIEQNIPEATQLGCQLVSNLMESAAGAAIVRESALFETLMRALSQMKTGPILSQAAVDETRSGDYLQLLACILSNERGDQIVRPHLQYLVSCVDAHNQRLDLGRLMVKHLKPMYSKVARQVLRAVLTRGSLRLQLECLDKLDQMAVPSSADPVKDFNKWLIEILIVGARIPYEVTQGKKSSKVDAKMVHDRAVAALAALCGTNAIAVLFQSHLVSLQELGKSGVTLLVRLLASPDCFKQIQCSFPNFLDEQWSAWSSGLCVQYAQDLENELCDVLWKFNAKANTRRSLWLPTHLYRSLASNEEAWLSRLSLHCITPVTLSGTVGCPVFKAAERGQDASRSAARRQRRVGRPANWRYIDPDQVDHVVLRPSWKSTARPAALVERRRRCALQVYRLLSGGKLERHVLLCIELDGTDPFGSATSYTLLLDCQKQQR
eukprot:m.290443 g.290443  ORF g.290443 m.290443 type:complete len:1030 (-) comp17806_c0_seq1:1082-4171(-)